MPSLNRLLSDNLPVDPSKNTFTGNGSQTVFNLLGQVAAGSTNPSNLIVSLDGAIQEPTIDYSINNSTLTFTTAPDSGIKVVVVSRNSPFTYATNLPGDGTVTSSKIVAGNVTPDKLSTGAPLWNSGGDLTVNGNIFSRNLLLQGDNTNAFIRPNNANSTLYLGTHNTNHVSLLSNGNVGIGTSSPQAELHILGPSLGSSIGSKSNSLILNDTNANQSFLEINDYRVSSGLSWETAGFRIQQKTDNSFQSYIQFNGNNNHGISIGTGSTTVNAHSVPERIRITQNGTIDLKNNPVINCTNAAAAWVYFNAKTGWLLQNASNTNSLVPYSGTTRVDWRTSLNGWWDWYIGIVYYINVSNTFSPLGGVNSVTRPNGFQGVRIRLVEIIQNAPISIARFEFLDGVATNSNIITGTGNTDGFRYIGSPIYESYNVSSITKFGDGDYGVNFINPMPNRNYAVIGNSSAATDNWSNVICPDMTNIATAAIPNVSYFSRRTTSSTRFTVRRSGANTVNDPYSVNIAVYAASGQDNV